MRFVALVIALVAVSSPLAGQQTPPPLAPGTRVRVTVAGGEPGASAGVYVGLYGGRNDVNLVVQPASAPVSIPLGQLRSLEVSRGRKLSVIGGTVGASIGATVGFFAVGCLANRDGYGVLCLGQDDSKFVLGAVAGGLVGAAIGALLFRREHWQVVELWPTFPAR